MASGGAGAGPEEGTFADLRELIQGLHDKIGVVREDIGSVKELSDQIAQGNPRAQEADGRERREV